MPGIKPLKSTITTNMLTDKERVAQLLNQKNRLEQMISRKDDHIANLEKYIKQLEEHAAKLEKSALAAAARILPVDDA